MENYFKTLGIADVALNVFMKASLIGIIYLAGYYQLSTAWFIAPVAVLVANDRRIELDRKRRDVAKALALTDEKDLVTANLKDLPAWVFFPDVEKVEWINRILKKLWPNISPIFEQIVRDKIQPVIRTKLNKMCLRGFQFETINLGSIPLRIGGVEVYQQNLTGNEIVMDLDLQYFGDCKLSFTVLCLKGGIKDIQLHGKLRVVLKPLMTCIPLIGGAQVFFLEQPKIDFELTGVADMLQIPGIRGSFKKSVDEIVAGMMVLPNKYSINLSDEIDSTQRKTPEPEGILRVHIVEANNLMRKGESLYCKDKSDSYVVATVGTQELKTRVINDTSNPKWDYWCEFEVMEPDSQSLHIQLWCKDDNDDSKLGSVTIEISDVMEKNRIEKWYTLEDAQDAQLYVGMTWLTLSNNCADLPRIVKQLPRTSANLSTALLILIVHSAKNLQNKHEGTVPDPYAVINVGNKIHQTEIKDKTANPVWDEAFSFLLSDLENTIISLKIMDKKTETEIGQLDVTIKSLYENECLEIINEPYSLVSCLPDSKVLLSFRPKILKVPDEFEDHRNRVVLSNSPEEQVQPKPEFPEVDKRSVEEAAIDKEDQNHIHSEKNQGTDTSISDALLQINVEDESSQDEIHYKLKLN